MGVASSSRLATALMFDKPGWYGEDATPATDGYLSQASPPVAGVLTPPVTETLGAGSSLTYYQIHTVRKTPRRAVSVKICSHAAARPPGKEGAYRGAEPSKAQSPGRCAAGSHVAASVPPVAHPHPAVGRARPHPHRPGRPGQTARTATGGHGAPPQTDGVSSSPAAFSPLRTCSTTLRNASKACASSTHVTGTPYASRPPA